MDNHRKQGSGQMIPSPINTDVLQPHPAYRIQREEQHHHTRDSQMPRYNRQQPEDDPRAFYPYQPNEVKHRKRTTRAQLTVLEDIFTGDQKPAAPLRKDLAAQLGMTTRGVQVWFQNRRAKEKTLAKKLAMAREKAGLPAEDTNNSDDESPLADSPRSSAETELAPETPPEALLSPNDFANSEVSLPLLHSPWHNSSNTSPVEGAHGIEFDPALDAHILSLRRGSLPVNVYAQSSRGPTYGPPSVDPREVFSRRRSVDMKQLAFHPYAPLAMQKNNHILRQPVRISSPVPSGRIQGPSHYQARASLPLASEHPPFPMRQHSMDGRGGFNFSSSMTSSSTSPHSSFQPGHAPRYAGAYAMSTRTISSPIPGPLPTPNFSFGAPSCSSSASLDGEQGMHSFEFPRPSAESDFDDDSSASYGGLSRFGSVVSVAGSDTSAYYSDLGSCDAYDAPSRRGSYASGVFPDLMSSLAVNSSSQEQHELGNGYPAGGDLLTAANLNGTESHSGGYASPSSTVSPGSSPHPQQGSPTGTIPISRSSELSGALHNQDQLQRHSSSSNSPVGGDELRLDASAFLYVQEPGSGPSSQHQYSHHFDEGANGHYQPYVNVDGPYTPEGTFSTGDVAYNPNQEMFAFQSHMRSGSGGEELHVGPSDHFASYV